MTDGSESVTLLRRGVFNNNNHSNNRGLDKNTGSAHFQSQRMHQNAGFCIKNIQKNSGGRDPRTTAAEGETFVRPHSRAHLTDADAPPLLLGWLRP